MSGEFILDTNRIREIENSSLFYPSSGNDWITPIRIFSPVITEYWFVDKGYFVPGCQDTQHYGFDAPADKQAPLLKEDSDYRLIDIQHKGPVSWDWCKRDIEPCVLTETYIHQPSKKHIRIHRRRGYGFSAFRNQIHEIGVFFYRGDSLGEGGSGNLWLEFGHINEVCNKLMDGGLIVTDGSNSGWNRRDRQYRELSKYNFQSEEAMDFIHNKIRPFQDRYGRTFTCIGYAGQRYGPTMIWQVRKNRR